MSRAEQRQTIRETREALIDALDALYNKTFEQLSELDIGEGAIARLTQLILLSKEAAITPLKQEIESPKITSAPLTK